MLGLCCCKDFSLVLGVGTTLQLGYVGSSLWWPLLLQNRGSGELELQQLQHEGSVSVAARLQSTGSILVAQGFSSYTACGIFLNQGWNPCLLHSQAASLPPSL